MVFGGTDGVLDRAESTSVCGVADRQDREGHGGTTTVRLVHGGFLADDWEAEYDALNEGDAMYLSRQRRVAGVAGPLLRDAGRRLGSRPHRAAAASRSRRHASATPSGAAHRSMYSVSSGPAIARIPVTSAS